MTPWAKQLGKQRGAGMGPQGGGPSTPSWSLTSATAVTVMEDPLQENLELQPGSPAHPALLLLRECAQSAVLRGALRRVGVSGASPSPGAVPLPPIPLPLIRSPSPGWEHRPGRKMRCSLARSAPGHTDGGLTMQAAPGQLVFPMSQPRVLVQSGSVAPPGSALMQPCGGHLRGMLGRAFFS